ncbi:hypothetical protein TcasGA2_TC008453 [Tribolium castaneum]|uniref:Uncharacterized protein n=1 Tax=Tribolium castaneum TaxID=7070 RepID=D2A230_TRICA|nr:hypothetical protein TcasGA2_TC008453 [Tribolium castaneum]
MHCGSWNMGTTPVPLLRCTAGSEVCPSVRGPKLKHELIISSDRVGTLWMSGKAVLETVFVALCGSVRPRDTVLEIMGNV